MSSLSTAAANGFDDVRGEKGVEGWWVSLEEAQTYVVGNEAWWNTPHVTNVVSIPPTEKPIWMYSNGDMYLGEWEYCPERKRMVEQGVGATYIHNPAKFRGVIYVGGWKQGDFAGRAEAFWLESSPTWIKNELADTGIRQETRDGKVVGRPYSYSGIYEDNVETDERAIVSLKDGTTRIGPWAGGKPVGDWWKDHVTCTPHPAQGQPAVSTSATSSNATEQRAPTITPPKKRKQSPVMTSRERKRGLSETVSARPCHDSDNQKALQETEQTAEQNQETSMQEEEAITFKQEEDEETVSVDTDQKREEEITAWLVTVIGYNPSKALMSEYAKHFIFLGLHSSQMIRDVLPASRVSTLEWMREFHRVQFLSSANLKR